MSNKKITIHLTVAEAQELHTLIGQGWGDGDHEQWLRNAGSSQSVRTCLRAIMKVENAIDDAIGERIFRLTSRT